MERRTICGLAAILMGHRMICGLASCRAALLCGVRLPCEFDGAFVIRKLSERTASFCIFLCRFLADSFSISFQNAG